jgi:hypothetical protein
MANEPFKLHSPKAPKRQRNHYTCIKGRVTQQMPRKQRDRKELKSTLPVRLVLKGQDFELSAQGTITTISKELDALRQLARYASAGKAAELVLPTVEKVAHEFPSIKPTKSTTGNIQSLFETNWGRNLKTVSEVARALEASAVPDSVRNISSCLTKMTKKGVLKRVKRAGKWAYYKPPSE